MRRLLVRHPNVVGLVMPASLMPHLAATLRGLLGRGNLQDDTLSLNLRWLEIAESNGGLSVSAVARLAGVGYDAILSRIKQSGEQVRREGRMLILPPATAVRLAWPRLLLLGTDDLPNGDYWLTPMARPVLRTLALEWHSLLFPPGLRRLAQALVDGREREIRGDRIAQLLGEETLRRSCKRWQRAPVAVRVVFPRRTLAATTFAAEDLVRLWWNRCVVVGEEFKWPIELERHAL